MTDIKKAGNSGLWVRLKRDMRKNWRLYVLALPAIVTVIVFRYAPMYGLQIAFKNFKPVRGIWGSPWVGLKYFEQFIDSYQFWKLIRNTLTLSIYSIVANFPAPILLALMLNQLRNERYKKIVQTVTYMPHFISMVVLVGMMNVLLSSSSGLYGNLMKVFGVSNPPNLFANKELFSTLYVFSGVWQNTGWDSIIYLAALTAVSPELHEAAAVDGAGKLKRTIHIDIPALLPTATILLILRMGSILGVGFEKVYLMQNDLNEPVSEIISTYVYKVGLRSAQYSYSAAISLFNTLINFAMLLVVNTFARKVGDTSLW